MEGALQSSRKGSLRSRKSSDMNPAFAESTDVVFPSPANDTQSMITKTPDFHPGSMIYNRFKVSNFNPTSPIQFSEVIEPSNDSDFLIFHPQGAPSISIASVRTDSDKVPQIQDLLEDYSQFELNNPTKESINISDFFKHITIRNFTKPAISPIPFCTISVREKYDSVLSTIKKDISELEKCIELKEGRIANNPPPIIENFYNLSSEEVSAYYQNLNGHSSIIQVDSAIFALNQVRSIEEEMASAMHPVSQLMNSKKQIEDLATKDPRIQKRSKLLSVREKIKHAESSDRPGNELESLYRGLIKITSFGIREIRKGIATIEFFDSKKTINSKECAECHAHSAESQRRRNFEGELIEIGKYLPNIRQDGSKVGVSFAKEAPELLFSVEFIVGSGYPWAKLRGSASVKIGNEGDVKKKVDEILKSLAPSRYPILRACQQISKAFGLF